MSKPPGRPKSDDAKLPLTIRVRSSVMATFADVKAAREAIEALVEAHHGPGLRSELAKAMASARVGSAKAAPAALSEIAKPAQAARQIKSRLKGEWKAP